MVSLVTRFYPKRLQKAYQDLLEYCDIDTPLDRYLSYTLIIGFIVSFILSLFIRIFASVSFLLLFLGIFLLFQGVIYAWLTLTADSRAKFIETLLPDVLQLMASNLRAGLTPDRALLLSGRPEFGRFREEINRMGKEMATGKELHKALTSFGERVKSEKLKKTFQLIVSAMASGGELADLLEQTASNLRQQKLVEERIRSSVLVYVIFIFSAIAFGSPMLYGLSSFLVEVITDVFSKVQLPPGGSTGMPISFTEVSISVSFVNTYVIVALISTSIMGSLILGLISKGKEKEGLKFLPVLIIITISLLFIVKYLISTLLGGLFSL